MPRFGTRAFPKGMVVSVTCFGAEGFDSAAVVCLARVAV